MTKASKERKTLKNNGTERQRHKEKDRQRKRDKGNNSYTCTEGYRAHNFSTDAKEERHEKILADSI